jgi:SAM-dependent methyltransferase
MSEYIFDQHQQEREFRRLQLVEQALDPITIRHLVDARIQRGWRCLEIGAGAGSIARWLAHAISERGAVVAVDRNTVHFRNGIGPLVQLIEGDFLDVPIGNDFDLAHCRYVLIHNRTSDLLLRKLAGALRPGGILIVEEPDFTSAKLLNQFGDPSQKRVNNAICRMFEELSLDPAYGFTLPQKVDAVGLAIQNVDSCIHLACGGSALARMMAESTAALADKYVATTEASPPDIEQYIANAHNPHFWAVYYSTVSVIASKPQN